MLLDVTSFTEPDPQWSWRDKAGHVHREAADVLPRQFPTLAHIQDAPATDEYPADNHWECRECGEWVPGGYPGEKSRQHRDYIWVGGID